MPICLRLLSGRCLAALIVLTAAPLVAARAQDLPQTDSSPHLEIPTAPRTLPPANRRDQARGIEFLLEALKAAPDASSARYVEQRIWAIWARTPSDSAALLMARVNRALDAKKMDVALRLLDAIVKTRPDYIEAWNRRATIHFLRNNYDAAMSDLHEVLVREPRHFGALAGLGMILHQTGDDRRALDAFRKALAINPHLERVPELVKTLAEKVEGRDI